MESTEEFQSKKDLISITEIFPEKKSHSILMDMSKMPTSIDNLAKSPMRGPIKFNPRSQNEYNPNGYLSLNQNDLSYDSVKTVKRNLSSQNVKIDGVNVKNNEPRAFSGYYSFSKNLRKNSEHQEAIVKDKDLSGELTPQITGLKKNSNFERNIMKKQSMMVRLKMPEKYKVIFEDLKNDKLENVDLSNAGFFILLHYF